MTHSAFHCYVVHSHITAWTRCKLHSLDGYAGCFQLICYAIKNNAAMNILVHRVAHTSSNIEMNFYKIYLGEERLIYKIKSNCFPKYGFTLSWAMYQSSCFKWSATLLLSKLKYFCQPNGCKNASLGVVMSSFLKRKTNKPEDFPFTH